MCSSSNAPLPDGTRDGAALTRIVILFTVIGAAGFVLNVVSGLLYIGWIESAKREETKARRLQEAIRLLTAGKPLGLK